MGENPKPASPPHSSSSPTRAISPWVDPRLCLFPWLKPAAMMTLSGGGGQGSKNPKLSAVKYAHRHPPLPTTSMDPYWIRGGLQPLTADDISDDEADLSYLDLKYQLWDPLEDQGPDSCGMSEIESVPPLPWTPSEEGWAAAVAEADEHMKALNEKYGFWRAGDDDRLLESDPMVNLR